jgi:magnesium-transporting ATPase (P-type)
VLGGVSALLVLAGFLLTLRAGGWHPGDATGPGSPLHHTWQQATTMTFLGIVACQIGTAFAARTETASLRTVGVFTNRLLLWGIGFELALAAIIVYLPPMNRLLGTAPLGLDALLFVLPFPFIVWGADELRRFVVRRSGTTHQLRTDGLAAGT